MKVLTVTSPQAVPHLQGMLVGDYAHREEEFLGGLADGLIENPQSIFFLLAVEPVASEDGFEIRGFLIVNIARGHGDDQWAFIHQAWVHPEEPALAKTFFNKLCFWAQDRGVDKIRGETDRTENAIYKKWGFRTITKVVQYDIPVDYIDKLLESDPVPPKPDADEEPQNGDKNIDNLDAESVPTTSGGEDRGLSSPASGEGGSEHPVRVARPPGARAAPST